MDYAALATLVWHLQYGRTPTGGSLSEVGHIGNEVERALSTYHDDELMAMLRGIDTLRSMIGDEFSCRTE